VPESFGVIDRPIVHNFVKVKRWLVSYPDSLRCASALTGIRAASIAACFLHKGSRFFEKVQYYYGRAFSVFIA